MPLAEQLGALTAGLAGGGVRTRRGLVPRPDRRARHPRPDARVAEGIFERSVNEPVTFVNAPMLARDRGVTVSEMRSTVSQDYVSLDLDPRRDRRGPIVPRGRSWPRTPRVIPDRRLRHGDRSAARMVFFRYVDRPGIIGKVGTILGDAGINIATMDVGRSAGRRGADGVTVDSEVPPEVQDASPPRSRRATSARSRSCDEHHTVMSSTEPVGPCYPASVMERMLISAGDTGAV